MSVAAVSASPAAGNIDLKCINTIRTLSMDAVRILICGSGVGACVAANKVIGARAALCHDDYSARQGAEDDNVNILCLGGRTTGMAVAWDCTRSFLNAKFSDADRHRRRLAKVLKLEESRTASVGDHN